MRFAEPMWLLAGLLAGIGLLVLYRVADRGRQRALDRFASHHLVAQLTASLSPGRRRLKRALIMCGLAGLCLTLARPQLGFHWEEARRQGMDILFAVDTSRSMLAQDVRPDRLTRAKLAVSDLVGKFDGDRVGLIAFAGEAFLQCPLTLDHEVFRESLAVLQPGIIPRGGTDLAAAINAALAALASEPRNHKILVLLTDGEDLEGRALSAARDAGRQGLRIYAIGVGTPQGELIPAPGQDRGQFQRDESGALVKSRLDEPMLMQIAEVTGGVYQPLGQQGQGLEEVYQHTLSLLPKQEVASRMHKIFHERYQWPLVLALFCLSWELLLSERRRRSALLRVAAQQRATGFQQVAVGLLCLALPVAAHASPQSAERAYQRGDYTKAAQEYGQAANAAPKKSELHFNLGTADYKSERFDQAAAAFNQALRTERVDLQEPAYYDLGNTQYRAGQQELAADRAKTIATWKEAIASYEAALKLRPDDADAKYNRDFVQRKLEELEKKEKQQDQKQAQNSQKQSQGGQGQQQKQNQGGQGQSQQTQNQQGQQPKPSQGQGQQPQQAQNQQGQQPRPSQGQGQQPQQAQHQPGQEPQPGQGQDQDRQAQRQQGPQPSPGEMTKEEAQSLLDSLRDEGRSLSFAPDTRSGQPRPEQTPTKDW